MIPCPNCGCTSYRYLDHKVHNKTTCSECVWGITMATSKRTFPEGESLYDLGEPSFPWFFRDQQRTRPDMDIVIERVGGGAAVEGYVAFVDGHKLCNEGECEDFKEEDCFLRALQWVDKAWRISKIPPFAFGLLEEPYMRAWFFHDLDDAISAIDLPGGMLS
jgi:hypothetical protein